MDRALITPVLTFVLAFTFVFGQSMQRVWSSFIEVVITKRFRVGDWVEFTGYPGFECDKIDMLEVSGLDSLGNRVSVATYQLWGLPLQNSNRSGFFRIRMYIQLSNDTPETALKKAGADILDGLRERRSLFQESSFELWNVADQANNAFLGWNQLFDLRVRTLCLQVNLPNLLHSDWTKTRDLQTAFQEMVRQVFLNHGAKYGDVVTMARN